MRAVIQRVDCANVVSGGKEIGKINEGLLVLIAFAPDDSEDQISWMVHKLLSLRIFSDEEGKMNKSIVEIEGEILVVSQFTLLADYTRGKRPGFSRAASSSQGKELYDQFQEALSQAYGKVSGGVFGAEMKVTLVNDGPATFVLDR
tara:strand:- start:3683 stop:4120 length:438 start_codon:yes stop_codon:yes gene_type:complete